MVQFGLTLPNKGVFFGVGTMEDLVHLGVEAEESGLFQTLWVGDSLLAKRRPESVVLLSALAARTRRIRLGVGCMASFPNRHPVVLATQWATLDLLAGPGRVILAACQGRGGDWQMEQEAFGVPPRERARRLEEGIEALRLLWTHDRASYQGQYLRFTDIVCEPKPATKPCPPLWIAANPRPALADSLPIPLKDRGNVVERSTRRIARLADGWMTTLLVPEEFGQRWQAIRRALDDEGRDSARFDNCLYYNANINEDHEAALQESKRFLDAYYETDFSRTAVESWVALGGPERVIANIRRFVDAGAREITIRLTSWDQRGQLRRLMTEVMPAFQ